MDKNMKPSILDNIVSDYKEVQIAETESDFEDLLDNAPELRPTRKTNVALLNPIFKMRSVDDYYSYLDEYKKGKFKKSVNNKIIDYQLFNKYTDFYNSDDCNSNKNIIWNGIQLDIIDLFVDKVLTTNLRYYNGDQEVGVSNLTNEVLEDIVKGLLMYERILIVPQKTKTPISQEIINGEVIEETSNPIFEKVKIYAPHEYDIEAKKFLLKDDKGKLKEVSFGKAKHYELEIKEGLLSRKKELVYLLSMFINNFGVEGNSGVMKIHADSRYMNGMNQDMYEIYEGVMTGSTQEPKPLFQFTQGDIRPGDWSTALDKIIYLINRSVGIDIQGLVYSTATQANLSNVDDIIKINKWLKKISGLINDLLLKMDIKNITVKFDNYTQDTVNEDLDRLNLAYQNKGITLEDNIKETYRILNLGKLSEEELKKKVIQVKIEQSIATTTDEIGLMEQLDVEMSNMEGQ